MKHTIAHVAFGRRYYGHFAEAFIVSYYFALFVLTFSIEYIEGHSELEYWLEDLHFKAIVSYHDCLNLLADRLSWYPFNQRM